MSNSVEPPRSLKREQIRSMLEDPGYALIQARIRDTIERFRSDLESDQTHESTIRARGLIAGLRLALEIPNILLAELSHER